jgi:hypothetical protein
LKPWAEPFSHLRGINHPRVSLSKCPTAEPGMKCLGSDAERPRPGGTVVQTLAMLGISVERCVGLCSMRRATIGLYCHIVSTFDLAPLQLQGARRSGRSVPRVETLTLIFVHSRKNGGNLENATRWCERTQAGSLCYITPSRRHRRCTATAPEIALRDRSRVRKANVA